jgi:hypothetical protein
MAEKYNYAVCLENYDDDDDPVMSLGTFDSEELALERAKFFIEKHTGDDSGFSEWELESEPDELPRWFGVTTYKVQAGFEKYLYITMVDINPPKSTRW